MKRFLFALAVLSTVSCSDSNATPTETKSISKADHYVVKSTLIWDSDLEERVSLISKEEDRIMFALHGDDEPILLGLSGRRHLFKTEGNRFEYLHPNDVLLFTFGPVIKKGLDEFSEIILRGTDRAVGYVHFSSLGKYPNAPLYVVDLCTGAYEKVCNLSYNKEKELFEIEFVE